MGNRCIINISLLLILSALMVSLIGCAEPASTKQPAKAPTACQAKAAVAHKDKAACKAADVHKDKVVCMRSALVGTWELTYESRRGTRTRKLVVNKDMTGTYEGRNSNTPITEMKIDGHQVSFKVERSFRERKFITEFKGKIDGSSFNGEFTTSRGSRAFTGKKIETPKG